jgi:Protein of unknown function (DUF3297)
VNAIDCSAAAQTAFRRAGLADSFPGEMNQGLKKMTDTPPDRLSTDPSSPYYDAEVLARDVGIRFKGVDRNNVEEYCVSEGWVRMTAGNAKDRYGNPMTIKVSGPVEPYFRSKS